MRSFIYIEPTEEKIDPIVKQIAAKLKGFPAEVYGEVTGISVGPLGDKAQELGGFLDKIIEVEAPEGTEYNTEAIASLLTDIVRDSGPNILFFGFTHQGMELAPAVSWRLSVPLAAACTDINLFPGKASVQRFTHAGKVCVSIDVDTAQGAVFSIQKGALKVETDPFFLPAPPPIVSITWKDEWTARQTQVVEVIKEAVAEGDDISKAKILVSVGRGLGNPENLPPFRELASLLGGMLSCSRPVVDLGWLSPHHQVGISGKSVSPVFYLAFAISGQANHIVAMESSKIIIAVNKDPQAPIFQVAHYGVIDDIHQFVPGMIEYLKKDEVQHAR
jgi:electron transfer flavoprotein alpha subunit